MMDPCNILSQPSGSTNFADIRGVVLPANFTGNKISSVTLLAMAGAAGGMTSYVGSPTTPTSSPATGAGANLDGEINMGDVASGYFWQVVGTGGSAIEI